MSRYRHLPRPDFTVDYSEERQTWRDAALIAALGIAGVGLAALMAVML